MFNTVELTKSNSIFSHLIFILLCLMVFLLLSDILIRFISLNSDPHPIVYRDVISDEGWFTQNARNHYLFNNWVLDEHNPAYILCPIYTFAERFSFSLFGNTLYSSRLLSAVSLSIVCILIILRLFKNKKVAILSALLIASNPYLFFYSRTAFVESFQLLAITLTWYFSSFQKSKRILFLRFLSGVFAAITVFIKPTAAIIIAFSVFSPWVTNQKKRFSEKTVESLSVIIGGILVIVSMLPFYLLEIDLFIIEFTRENHLITMQNGFSGLVTPLFYGLVNPFKTGDIKLAGYNLVFIPILFLLSLIFFGGLLKKKAFDTPFNNNEELDYIFRISLLWVLFVQLSFFLQFRMHTQPRYWINLFIPISIILIIRIFNTEYLNKRQYNLSRISAVSGVFFIIYILRPQLILFLLNNFNIERKSILVFILTAILFLLAFILGLVTEKLLRKRTIDSNIFQIFSRSLIILVILFWSIYNGINVFQSTFTMDSTITDINSIIGNESVVTGGVSNTLSIGSKRYAFVTRNLGDMGMGTGIINANWSEKGVTHIIETIEENGAGNEKPVWIPYGSTVPIKTYNLLPDNKSPSGYRFKVLLSEWHK